MCVFSQTHWDAAQSRQLVSELSACRSCLRLYLRVQTLSSCHSRLCPDAWVRGQHAAGWAAVSRRTWEHYVTLTGTACAHHLRGNKEQLSSLQGRPALNILIRLWSDSCLFPWKCTKVPGKKCAIHIHVQLKLSSLKEEGGPTRATGKDDFVFATMATRQEMSDAIKFVVKPSICQQ